MSGPFAKPRCIAPLLLAVAVFLLLNGPGRSNASERHLIWTAGTLTLMGSIHTLSEKAFPLPDVFLKSYRDADVLVFETDMERLNTPDFQAEFQSLGLYPDGDHIQNHLSPHVYHKLLSTLDELHIPKKMYTRFRPWFCALALTTLHFQEQGYGPRNGLDSYFFNMAQQDGKTLAHLESPEDQLHLLQSLNGDEAEEKFLLQSLQQMGGDGSMAEEMASAWARGDAGALHSLIMAGFEDFPKLYERFFIQRNRNWLPAIEKLIHSGNHCLVIVGAGHLVGPRGLVRMLEDQGCQVHPIRIEARSGLPYLGRQDPTGPAEVPQAPHREVVMDVR